MKGHAQEAISGLLDGQLPRWQRRRVLRHVRACPVCAAEYRRQRQVQSLLQENRVAPTMSISGDQFWARVRGAIQNTAAARAPAIPAPTISFWDWLRGPRWAMAAVAVSVVAVVVLLAASWHTALSRPSPGSPGPVAGAPPSTPAPFVPVPRPMYAYVERATTVLPNTSVTAFDSKPAGVTVVWVDGLPWTPDMDEMKTLYANLDS